MNLYLEFLLTSRTHSFLLFWEESLIVKRVKRVLHALQKLSLLFPLAFTAHAISGDTPLVVALPDSGYPPYVIVDDTHTTGILVESIKRASLDLGIKINFEFLPERRSLKALQECSIDARMESHKWSDSPDSYLWSHPIVEIEDVLIANKGDSHTISALDDLVGHEIITHIGYSYPTLERYFKAGTVVRSDRYQEIEMLRALLRPSPNSRRLVIMDRNVALSFINREPQLKQNLDFIDLVIATAPLQLQFCNNELNSKRVTLLNDQLKALESSGELSNIRQVFLSNHN